MLLPVIPMIRTANMMFPHSIEITFLHLYPFLVRAKSGFDPVKLSPSYLLEFEVDGMKTEGEIAL